MSPSLDPKCLGLSCNVKLNVDKPNSIDWMMNPGILNSQKDIAKSITDHINDNVEYAISPCIKWDAMKAVVRGSIIEVTLCYKKQTEYLWQNLITQISELERVCKRTGSQRIYKTLVAEGLALELLELHENLLYLKQKFWKSPKTL